MAAQPVIIDCDPGTDDTIALLLALASPELDVRAVTAVGGNVGLDRTLPNALAVTALAGKNVPVYAGSDRPLLGAFLPARHVHGDDGLLGVKLPAGGEPAPGIAADAIRAILREAASPVALVGIGPMTNLALALATEPVLAAKAGAISLMAGAWGEGNTTPSAEFNALSDPEALAVVLACRRPIALAGLELTAQALVTPARIDALRRRGAGRCLRAACGIMAAVTPSERLGGLGHPLHDPCAVAWLIRPTLFKGRSCSVMVETHGAGRGRTIIDRWGRSRDEPNVTVLETLDVDGFFELLGERLATLP